MSGRRLYDKTVFNGGAWQAHYRPAASGRRKDEPNIWKYGELTVDFSGYSACNQNGKIDVTPKELDLLKLLVEHKGLVLSRSQILNAVWGDDSYVIDRIVDSYIRNLRKKIGT